MKKFLSKFNGALIPIIFVIIYIFLLSLFNYVGLIKSQSIIVINFIFSLILIFTLGIKRGKKTSKKGFLEGIKLGSIILIIMLLLNIVFYRVINSSTVIYYLGIIAVSTLGSMIGINLKKN